MLTWVDHRLYFVYLSIWQMPLESCLPEMADLSVLILSCTIRRREWRGSGLKWRCLWRGYRNLHITCPAWNLPYDRAWEKAPPYDRAWKKTSHILGIRAYIPSIHRYDIALYHIQAYMLLYTRFMVEYKSIWQYIPGLRWYISVYADIYWWQVSLWKYMSSYDGICEYMRVQNILTKCA
jgi:hypothetical protein